MNQYISCQPGFEIKNTKRNKGNGAVSCGEKLNYYECPSKRSPEWDCFECFDNRDLGFDNRCKSNHLGTKRFEYQLMMTIFAQVTERQQLLPNVPFRTSFFEISFTPP